MRYALQNHDVKINLGVCTGSPAPSVARRLDLGDSSLDSPKPAAPAALLAAAAAAAPLTGKDSPAAATAAYHAEQVSADASSREVARAVLEADEAVSGPATPELLSYGLALPLSGTSTADSAISSTTVAAASIASGSANAGAAPSTQPAHATWTAAGAATAQPAEETTAPDCSVPSDLEASPLQGVSPAPQRGYLAAASRARAAAAADIAAVLLVGNRSSSGADSSSHHGSPVVLAGGLTNLIRSTALQVATAVCREALRHRASTLALRCCSAFDDTSLMCPWLERERMAVPLNNTPHVVLHQLHAQRMTTPHHTCQVYLQAASWRCGLTWRPTCCRSSRR